MSRVLYTSDTHFNHTFVAGTRGYETSEEHDEALIEAINTATHKRDHLWILGDVFMGSITEGLKQVKRLNPTLHLVLGNHDGAHPLRRGSHNKLRWYLEGFESVSLHEQHRIGGYKVNLSHFPYSGDHKEVDRYTQWRLPDEGVPLLHGHIHQLRVLDGHQLNVGVDSGFSPWTQEDVARKLNLS